MMRNIVFTNITPSSFPLPAPLPTPSSSPIISAVSKAPAVVEPRSSFVPETPKTVVPLFHEDAQFAKELLEYDSEFLDSERECNEIVRRYEEASGIKIKWGCTRYDSSLRQRVYKVALCAYGGVPRKGTRRTSRYNCPFRVAFSRCTDHDSYNNGRYKVIVRCAGHNHAETKLGRTYVNDSAEYQPQ